MLVGQVRQPLGGFSQVQPNIRSPAGRTNMVRQQPVMGVGFSPSKGAPLGQVRGYLPAAGQQPIANRGRSSFLTYPSNLAQQQILGQAIGFGRVRQSPVPGPTIQWPTARNSFLGSVLAGSPLGLGLSGDPDYLAKGIDLLLHRDTGSVYCPVCEVTYPTGALEQHILKHRQLEQRISQQHAADTNIHQRQSAMLAHAGLSQHEIHTPVIVEPEEFVIEEESVAMDNFFVVDNTVAPVQEPLPPQLGRQNFERTPLQYPIEHVNFYSCCDGVANRDPNSSFGDSWRRNEWIAHPRMLTEWERHDHPRN